ncbi:hypothetical protein Tco_1361118 [Tanacetum coccineum]
MVMVQIWVVDFGKPGGGRETRGDGDGFRRAVANYPCLGRSYWCHMRWRKFLEVLVLIRSIKMKFMAEGATSELVAEDLTWWMMRGVVCAFARDDLMELDRGERNFFFLGGFGEFFLDELVIVMNYGKVVYDDLWRKSEENGVRG